MECSRRLRGRPVRDSNSVAKPGSRGGARFARRCVGARAAAAFSLAIALLPGAGAARAASLVRLLGSEDAAPGFSSGERIDEILRVASRLSDDGTVVFSADVSGIGFPVALYRRRPSGEIERLAVASRNAFGGDAIASLRPVANNGSGDTLVFGRRPRAPKPCAEDPSETEREFGSAFRANGGERLAAETFLAVPGESLQWERYFGTCAPLRDFACFDGALFQVRPDSTPPSLLAEDGGAAFVADVSSDACEATRSRFLRVIVGPDGAGGERLVLRVGEAAPGVPGASIGSSSFVFRWSSGSMNASGQLAFLARTDQGPVLYRWDPGLGLVVLARQGAPAPLAGDVAFDRLGMAALSADGTPALFVAEAGPPEGSSGSEESRPAFSSLWGPDRTGALRRLLAVGEPVPGGPEDSTFASFDALSPFLPDAREEPPFVNSAGEVAVSLPILLPDIGILPAVFGPDENGELALRRIAFGPAPALPGFLLSDLTVLGLSDDRRILARARVRSDLDTSESQDAWYRLEPTGEATLLLGPSDTLAIVPEDPQPVSSARSVALHASADLAHFVVEARSPPGSGSALFVLAVPEAGPFGAGFAALASLGGLARRRRSSKTRVARRSASAP